MEPWSLMMNTTNVARAVLLLSAAFAVVHCAVSFERLPVRMMSHFDGAGRPNGFMPRADFLLEYALVSGGAVLLLLLVPMIPLQLVNVPNRDYWLAPEHRGELRAKLVQFSTVFAAGLHVFLVWLLEQTIEANLQQRPLDGRGFYLALAIGGAAVVYQLAWLVRAFRLPQRR